MKRDVFVFKLSKAGDKVTEFRKLHCHLNQLGSHFVETNLKAYLADAGDLLLGESKAWQGAVSGWRAVRGRGSRTGWPITHPC